MRVRVFFFGVLKDLVGRESDAPEIAEGTTVADLVRYYVRGAPALQRYSASMATSVNQDYAPPGTVLHDGDEVGLLPPVSGGNAAPPEEQTSSRALIVREEIQKTAIVAATRHPSDGAVVVFDGVVRDNSRGRKTLYLEYEAYEQMALRELEKLAEEAIRKFAIRELRVVHRLGRLNIGETSVLIVAASAHRAPAFEACRWMIDTLKKTVPIWKKEYFEDGAVWADGEPFPAQLTDTALSGGSASE